MELFKLLGIIAISNKEANDALDETTEKGEKAQGQLTKSFGKIGGAAVKIGTAMAGAAVAVGGALVAMTESTREYRNEMGKLDAAFTTAGHSSKAASKTYKSLQALLGETDQAVEAANHLAKLVDNEKDLSTWTDICTGVYATFGASLPIEGLTEAANETAKTGALTGSLADALNWAGVNEDKFQASLDACNTEQERQALITETLNGLYKETAANYKEINKDVLAANEAQERITAATARFGAILEPVVTAGKAGFATLLESVLPFAESLAVKVPAAMTMLQKTWESVLKPVLNFLGEIITKIAIPAVELLIETFKDMAEFAEEHFSWMEHVIDAAMRAIRGIIDAISAAIQGDWTGFWRAMVNVVKNIGSALYAAGQGVFQMLWDGLKFVWTSISDWIEDKVGWVVDKFETVKNVLSSIKDAVAEAAAAAAEMVTASAETQEQKNTSGSAKSSGSGKKTTKTAKHAEGGILTAPTIFGYTPSTDTYHLGGEAGDEAIAPIDVLQGYVRAAVAAENEGQVSLLKAILAVLQAILDKDTSVYLNSKEISKAVNKELGVVF